MTLPHEFIKSSCEAETLHKLYKNKNDPTIRWERPLHELIVGAKTMTQIPRDPNWALIHDKNLEKQLSQNAFYNQNFSREMNVRKG